MKIFLFISLTILIFISTGCDKINKTNTNSQSSDRALTGDQLMTQLGSHANLNNSSGVRGVTGEELMKSIGILPDTESKRRPPRNWIYTGDGKHNSNAVDSYYDPSTVVLSYDKRKINAWFLDLYPNGKTEKIRLTVDCEIYRYDVWEVITYQDENASGRPIKYEDVFRPGNPFKEGSDLEAICQSHRR